ncbi:MAG: hypothetical protein WEB60_01550 [Terrimicrobiaceae bacterium]
MTSPNHQLRAAAFFVALLPLVAMGAEDAGLAVGRPMGPVIVRWESGPQASPLPSWAPDPVELSENAAIFAIPPRWKRPAVDQLVLTVVFDDAEDVGPTVTWYPPNNAASVPLSEGLGESPTSLGLHARTVLVPQELTENGGRLEVSLQDRSGGLRSATLQPARDVLVAVVGTGQQPAVVERSRAVLNAEEVDGREAPPLSGDLRDGSILEAELIATVEPFDTEFEFVVPVEGKVEGAVLHAEVLGLDPGSCVIVEVNGQAVGEMNIASFRLDDPAVSIDEEGFLILAGWRNHSLFLPASYWKPMDNSIVIRLQNAPGPIIRQVSIKNVYLHLRFGAVPVPLAAGEPAIPTTFLPEDEEPNFSVTPDFIAEPAPLPLVVTTPPKPEPVLPRVTVTPPARGVGMQENDVVD